MLRLSNNVDTVDLVDISLMLSQSGRREKNKHGA